MGLLADRREKGENAEWFVRVAQNTTGGQTLQEQRNNITCAMRHDPY